MHQIIGTNTDQYNIFIKDIKKQELCYKEVTFFILSQLNGVRLANTVGDFNNIFN